MRPLAALDSEPPVGDRQHGRPADLARHQRRAGPAAVPLVGHRGSCRSPCWRFEQHRPTDRCGRLPLPRPRRSWRSLPPVLASARTRPASLAVLAGTDGFDRARSRATTATGAIVLERVVIELGVRNAGTPPCWRAASSAELYAVGWRCGLTARLATMPSAPGLFSTTTGGRAIGPHLVRRSARVTVSTMLAPPDRAEHADGLQRPVLGRAPCVDGERVPRQRGAAGQSFIGGPPCDRLDGKH